MRDYWQLNDYLFCAVLAASTCLAGKWPQSQLVDYHKTSTGLQDWSLAGGDITLLGCSRQLDYGVGYPVDLDLPEQRIALLSLFNSAGGAFWSWSADGYGNEELFAQLIADVAAYGFSVSQNDTVLAGSISSGSKTTDLAALPLLSANCSLQQALAFGQLLVKHQWDHSEVSYCQWHGVTCCKTVVSLHCCAFNLFLGMSQDQ